MASHFNLSKLLQLTSPMLPVGAYSYSQGLESAIESGLVKDAASAAQWIGQMLQLSLCRFELPLLLRLCANWSDPAQLQYWHQRYCASRESAELLAETTQMGYSLTRLLRDLTDHPALIQLSALQPPAFPTAYACAVQLWQIPLPEALHGYAWSWLENQVCVAIKLIPLGQTDGQRLLLQLGERLPDLLQQVLQLPDAEISNFTPQLAILSAQHETQYSRLFRS